MTDVTRLKHLRSIRYSELTYEERLELFALGNAEKRDEYREVLEWAFKLLEMAADNSVAKSVRHGIGLALQKK